MQNYLEIAKEVLQTESRELARASSELDQRFNEAVHLLGDTTGKVIVIGVGKSGLVGSKIAATLASTGTSSFFIHPTEAMHGDLGMVDSCDTVLAISYSGESEELVSILPHLKSSHIALIGMTANQDSSLARYSDIWLNIQITKEACPLNVAPTSSTTLTMAMGDALAVALMHRRNFSRQDFARLHPGGSLGKRLFVKVADMMRCENLPIVSHETLLKDAIVVMSAGRLGSLVITDSEDKIIGLLSDGDLRRALMQQDFDLNQSVIEYATKDPWTVEGDDMLASEALRLIEEKKVQALIITDKQKRLLGILHLHDLVEAGIQP